jgi:hypothetical protein
MRRVIVMVKPLRMLLLWAAELSTSPATDAEASNLTLPSFGAFRMMNPVSFYQLVASASVGLLWTRPRKSFMLFVTIALS